MRPLSGAEDGLLFLLFFGRGLFDLDIDLQFVLDLFGLIPDEAFGGPCAFREVGKGLGLAALFAGDVYAGGRPVPSAGYVLAVGILQDGEGLLFDGVSDAEVLAVPCDVFGIVLTRTGDVVIDHVYGLVHDVLEFVSKSHGYSSDRTTYSKRY